MATSTALQSNFDLEAFMLEYYGAWAGTDEDRIMSYYAENVTVQIPGSLMQGRSAVREQFVRPFITGFPGNRHVVKSVIFLRDVAVVEFTFEAEHMGPFAGREATHARVELPGCGVYECDLAKRQITAARIYLDRGTLLNQLLDQRHPYPRSAEEAAAPSGMVAAEHLDLPTVIAISQTVSGEMVLEKLLDTLMRTAVRYAGAERALLILSREAEQRIAAEATTSHDTVMVDLCDGPISGSLVPETVLHYVLHTRESVILDDAADLNPFSTDPYIAQRRARSVFCLPLMNQAKLIGILYLENNLAPRVFAPARTAVLKLLASQAAMAIENCRLYRELEESEAELRRAHNSFSDAQRLSKTGSFITDLLADDHNWSEEAFRIFEFEPGTKVTVQRIRQIVHPEDLQAFDSVLERGSRGIDVDFVFRIVTARGAMKHVRGTAHVVEEVAGHPMFVGALQDVTESKVIEEALKANEAELRRAHVHLTEAQRLSQTGSFTWDVQADSHTWSAEIYRIFGLEPGVKVSMSMIQSAIHPEDMSAVEAVIGGAVAGADFDLVFRVVAIGGAVKYAHVVGHRIKDIAERPVFVGAIQDVTESRVAEQALRESERSLRSAIDGIPGLVAILAPNGEIEAINRQIVEYYGRSLEELRNWDTDGTIHHEDAPHLASVFTTSITSGVPYQIEARFRRFDGEYRWFDMRGIPVRDTSDRIARWYVLLTDVEDRTQALTRLQQMQSDFAHMNRVSMMGELAASLSHEITQPIASARNNARAALNFLDRQPPDLSEVKEALGCVVGDADRAGTIIGRIRDHIRKAPPRKDLFDLNAAIGEVIALARTPILANGVSVKTRLANGLSSVHGDRVQLQQVVLNLVLNAVEAMSTNEAGARELLISSAQDSEGVLVTVRDSGPGIAPDRLEQVFDAFYTTKSTGTGMGLSICRSIIDAHGGSLWVASNKPRGAAFHFILPGAEARS